MPVHRVVPAVLLVALLVSGCEEGAFVGPDPAGVSATVRTEAPAVRSDDLRGQDVADGYIVVFKSQVPQVEVPALAAQMVRLEQGTLRHTYQTALQGFAAQLSPQAATRLAQHPNVASIEPDGVVTVAETQQNPPSWGLDRVDQRALPLDAAYTYAASGAGVTVYIVDTGIYTAHADFGGRASVGYDAVGDGQNGQDCEGHGTHVAGTVGSTTYGVAKDVTLVAVRVLNCNGSGSWSDVIAGVDWVMGQKLANLSTPMVANMSLGGGYNSSLNDAVTNAVNAGVFFAVAAGNENQNACNVSPASTPAALTLGATTSSDARASYSNYGACVDLFAPGSGITSTYKTGGTAVLSGTSMATPHAAGVAALYLDDHPGATPAAVTDALLESATPGVVGSPGSGSPNLLLYNVFGTVAPPPPPPPTSADFEITLKKAVKKINKKGQEVAKAVVTWTPGDVSGAKVDRYFQGSGDAVGPKSTANDGKASIKISEPGDGPFEVWLCAQGDGPDGFCSNRIVVDFAGVTADFEDFDLDTELASDDDDDE